MKYALASFLALVISISSFSQKGKDYLLVDSVNYETLSSNDKYVLDSLLPLYHKATHDTARLGILESLDENLNAESVWPRYNKLMYDEVLKHLKDSASLSLREIKAYKKYYATALQNFGYAAQYFQGNIPKAIAYYDTCGKIQEEVGDMHGLGQTLNNIGLIYYDKANVKSALEYFFRAMKIQEKAKDKLSMGYTLNNMASVYLSQRDTAKALETMEKSIQIRKDAGDKRGYALSLGSIGSLYNRKGETEKALSYFKTSLGLWEQIGEKQGLGYANQSIGSIYLTMAMKKQTAGESIPDSLYSLALNYLLKGLKYSEEVNEMYTVSLTLTNIGRCYQEQKNLSKAMGCGQRALGIGKKLGYPEAIRNSSLLLYEVYKQTNNWKSALDMHELYMQMRDSMFNKETQTSTFKQQAKYEYEKQQAISEAEHQKQLAVAEEEKKRQKIITYSIGLGLLMVVLFSIFIFNRLRITNKQKQIIEEQKKLVDQKNKHITHSINYAKRIQEAILPSQEEFKKCFPEYFIFFLPREIVSGDFYWLSNQNAGLNDAVGQGKTILAIADCTGHGVPGAFMSMIGNTLLNEIINEQKIFQPAEILQHLNEGIVHALHQESRSQDDGMDISVCVFEKNKITFAGANHSMYIIQNNSLEEIKGDIYSIGSMFGKKDVAFTQKEISLSKNMNLYFSTDGFSDQPGGEKRKKFLVKQMKDLLLSISPLAINEQKEKIQKSFEEWKGAHPQMDDVLLMGIKV